MHHMAQVRRLLCVSALASLWLVCSGAQLQMDAAPSGPVLSGTRLSIICHSPSPLLSLKSLTLRVADGAAGVQLTADGLRRLGDWRGRGDIAGSLSPQLGVVRLSARPSDSGPASCAAEFHNSTSRAASARRQLVVGTPPHAPQLQVLSSGRAVSWLPDGHEFTVRCSVSSSWPSSEIVVSVSGVVVAGSVEVGDDEVVFTRRLTASSELDGLRLLCEAKNVFGSRQHSLPLSVHFVNEACVISESVQASSDDGGDPEVVLPHGHFLACNGASNPAPVVNWTVPASAQRTLVRHGSLLEVTPKCAVGSYRVECRLQLPTGKVVQRSLRLRVVGSRIASFAPNVVGILAGVCLAISLLVNGIFATLLCKIYKSDETWNFQHEYTHIPIRRWVTKSMT